MDKASGQGAVRWITVGLLAVIAACLVAQLPSAFPVAQAQQDTGVSRGHDLMLVAGQLTRDVYGLYLVDPESRSICVYEWMPGNPPVLKLRAGRSFLYDRQLDEYNTSPSPREIKALVDPAKRLGNATTRPF